MTTINTDTQTVKGGYYLNVRDWKIEAVNGRTGTLPRVEGVRYVRIPLLAMLAVAPLLGLLFVVLLPFLGIAVVGEEVWRRARKPAVVPRVAPEKAVTARR